MTAQLDLAERWRFFNQPGTVITRHTAALEIPASVPIGVPAKPVETSPKSSDHARAMAAAAVKVRGDACELGLTAQSLIATPTADYDAQTGDALIEPLGEAALTHALDALTLSHAIVGGSGPGVGRKHHFSDTCVGVQSDRADCAASLALS